MMRYRCPQEDAVADALRQGHWHAGASDGLQAHARSCAICSEVVFVAQFLRESRAGSLEAASFQSPGALWWRAQLRRRYNEVNRAERPIALVEKLSLICIPLACVGLAAWQWTKVYAWLSWLAGAGRISDLFTDGIQASVSNSGIWASLLLIAALGTIALVGALAVYLLVQKE